MSYETIIYEKKGAVARILLNRPEKRNAQNHQMTEELDSAMKDAERDEEVRVVVLAGVGPCFSSGHDMTPAPSRPWTTGSARHRDFEREFYVGKSLYIRNLSKPTIAQVHSHCIAAALMLAAMCDLIVASEDALFSNPVGRMAASGVELIIEPWEVGFRKAKELLFTGDTITAEEARQLGLVNRVVPRERLDEEVMKLAERIALMPPYALRLTKASLNRTQDMMGYTNSHWAHHEVHMLAHASEEARQFAAIRQEKGLRAFFEARDAKFREQETPTEAGQASS